MRKRKRKGEVAVRIRERPQETKEGRSEAQNGSGVITEPKEWGLVQSAILPGHREEAGRWLGFRRLLLPRKL